MQKHRTKNRLWLLLTILIGFSLRLTLLGRQSLWYDEGVTWLLSQMRQLSDLIQWTAADIQPPLYYLLIWTTDIIFGHSEWALRFPSVVFNILTLPLLYVLGCRLFAASPSRRTTGLLAALLLAISPLMVYYSQEARMYTLLVFQATLAGYLLLKIAHPGRPASSPALTIGYACVATAALYTHYFAAFLLVAHALYLGLGLWRQGRFGALGRQALQMFGLTALLFAPWFTTLVSRLGDDPSYWPGALKLNEAVRKVLISFSLGETVLEQTGLWLASIYAGLWLLAFGLLMITHFPAGNPAPPQRPAGRPPRSNAFLLLWLLLPPGLILALSYQSPKFNPRYTMLAWPAFALLLAATLAGLWPQKQPGRAGRFWPLAARYWAGLMLLFIISVSTFSLRNWFTDARFSKDDFKALAQFVRERIGPDETVLLSSGHVFPVWAYYYGWDNWTPLPWLQRLDVNRVTDLSIAGDIAQAIEGKGGVWLVTWQDEVIDPNGVVPFWLDLIGQRPIDAGDFWGVGLEHWRLNPGKTGLLHQSPIKHQAIFNASNEASPEEEAGSGYYNFADQVDLLGLTQLSDTEIVLFWRPRRPLPDNLMLSLSLIDQDGFNWDREDFVGRPGAYLYPPSRWPVGQIVMTRHRLNWQTGTPPGLYMAEIGLGQPEQPASSPNAARAAADFVGWDVLDEQGRPRRRTALIKPVNLSHLVQPEGGPLPLDRQPLVDFFPIVGVRRSILPQKQAEPGDRILLALLWQAGPYNLDNISVAFDLVDAGRQTFRVGSSLTPSRRFNLPRWQPGDVVLGQYWLDIPPEAAPGPARLQLHLLHSGAFPYDELFPIDQLEILPAQRNFSRPASVDIPLNADFSGQTGLIGADCRAGAGPDCRISPGQPVTLTFYWQAQGPLDKNYTIFTHLLGPDEKVIVNADHAPPKPGRGWVAGEIIADSVALPIPPDLPPGDYFIEVGLYDAADPAFQRLPLATGETRVILPQTFTVEE